MTEYIHTARRLVDFAFEKSEKTQAMKRSKEMLGLLTMRTPQVYTTVGLGLPLIPLVRMCRMMVTMETKMPDLGVTLIPNAKSLKQKLKRRPLPVLTVLNLERDHATFSRL